MYCVQNYSGLFPCTPAADAPAFHAARYQDVANRYPGLDVILTEFGWPAGPEGYRETNERTGQQCGVAGEANQRLVLEGSLARFDQLGLPAVLFAAFREPWKGAAEGAVGPFWGTCAGNQPYGCPFGYGFRHRVTLPLVIRRSP